MVLGHPHQEDHLRRLEARPLDAREDDLIDARRHQAEGRVLETGQKDLMESSRLERAVPQNLDVFVQQIQENFPDLFLLPRLDQVPLRQCFIAPEQHLFVDFGGDQEIVQVPRRFSAGFGLSHLLEKRQQQIPQIIADLVGGVLHPSILGALVAVAVLVPECRKIPVIFRKPAVAFVAVCQQDVLDHIDLFAEAQHGCRRFLERLRIVRIGRRHQKFRAQQTHDVRIAPMMATDAE